MYGGHHKGKLGWGATFLVLVVARLCHDPPLIPSENERLRKLIAIVDADNTWEHFFREGINEGFGSLYRQ